MAEAERATEETGGKFGGYITDAGLKERQNPSYICGSCGNMLWNFKNDGSKLIRVCRNCGHKDDMESNLVYVNDVKFAGGTDHVASADMVKDPTLPLADNVDCPSCHLRDAWPDTRRIASQSIHCAARRVRGGGERCQRRRLARGHHVCT